MGDEVHSRKFVLLIGRNPVFRNVMAANLTAASWPVLTCANYREAAVLLLDYPESVSAVVLCVADQGEEPPPFELPVIVFPSVVALEGVKDVLKQLELLRGGIEQT